MKSKYRPAVCSVSGLCRSDLPLLVTLLFFVILSLTGTPVLAQGSPDILWMRGLPYAECYLTKFCATGERFITASNLVRIHRTSDGVLLRTFEQGDPAHSIRYADISADGKLVAIQTDYLVTVRSVDDGTVLYAFADPVTSATHLASGVSLSPDGKCLGWMHWGGSSVLSLVQLKPTVVEVFRNVGVNGGSMLLSPVTNTFLNGGALYNCLPLQFVRNIATYYALNFSMDGSTLFSHDSDTTSGHTSLFALTDTSTGNFLAVHNLPRTIHEPKQWATNIHNGTVTADGKHIAVGTVYSYADGGYELAFVDVWDGANFNDYLVTVPQVSPYGSAISSDGTTALFSGYISSQNRDYVYRVSGPDFSNPANTFPIPGHGARARAAECSPNGSFIASGSADGKVLLWSAGPNANPAGALLATLDHGSPVDAIAISPDSRIVVSASGDPNGRGDGTIKFWRVSDGVLLNSTPVTTWNCYAIAFSPDGNFLASSHQYDGYQIHRISRAADDSTLDYSLAYKLPGETNAKLAYSPDGNWFSIAGGDMYHVDKTTGAIALAYGIGAGGPIAFSADSRTFSTGGDGLTAGGFSVVIRDTATGTLVRSVAGHTGPVDAVALTHDGRYLLSASRDYTLKLWDLSDGSLVKTFDVETGGPVGGPINSLTFTPDDRNFVYSRQDSTVVVASMPNQKPPDTTAPVTTIALTPGVPASGWYNVPVSVNLTASDDFGGSGLNGTYYTVDGGAQQTYSAPFAVSTEGVHTVTYWSVDVAGNAETARSRTIQIDLSPPVVTWGTPSPTPNSNGWNNSAVDIPYTVTDNLSGNSSSGSVHIAAEGYGVTKSVTVTDPAGNTAIYTSPAVNIDQSPPSTPIRQDGMKPVMVTFFVPTDNLSLPVSTYYRVDHGTLQVIPYSYWSTWTKFSFSIGKAGSHTVDYYSIDNAGNVEPTQTLVVYVGKAKINVDNATLSLNGLTASSVRVTFSNSGSAYSTGMMITNATLAGVQSIDVPAKGASMPPLGSSNVDLRYSGLVFKHGQSVHLNIDGTCDNGVKFAGRFRFVIP